MAARLFLVLLVLAVSPAFAGQADVRQPDEEDLTILAFLQAVETSISTMDRQRWVDLLSSNADRDQLLEFFDAMVPRGVTRVVVKERDRSPLFGALPGEGYRLLAEAFIETGARGRIATWSLDVRRPRGADVGPQPWRIVSGERLSSVEGLHRLSLHPDHQFTAHDLVLSSVDFELRLPTGDMFVAETAEGVTALVLLGEGMMVFRPGPKEERGQLKIFSGTEALETPFSAAFVRLNPFEFEQKVTQGMAVPVGRDPRAYKRARGIFDEDVAKSFGLDLSDLSRDTWSLLPAPGDFVAEVRTKRFETLTYARGGGEAEDVTMFHRARKRNISAYASPQKLASRGRFYDEDALVDYDILDYHVETAFQPDREWIDGSTQLKIRVKAYALGTLTLRLADTLTVTSVTSDELGRLLFLKVKNQNSIVVNLPAPVARDFLLTLSITYSGRLARQGLEEESVVVAADQGRELPDEILQVPAERNWLFSNRVFWYPQGQVTDYATATLRVTVPADYHVVASGVLMPGSPALLAATPPGTQTRAVFQFNAPQPLRYLGIVVSKMTRVDAATVALEILPSLVPVSGSAPSRPEPIRLPSSSLQAQVAALQAAALSTPPIGARNTIALAIDANRRQENKARDTVGVAAEILRLYAGIMGDVPYDSLTVAMVEDALPGGHAPGYFAMINNPPPAASHSWRNDPAAFPNFPEFFIAHEIAHQWFGQAVGWKNYHEQWLSEGFAQYFAALYARQRRGDQTFREIIRQFRRWAMSDSDQGPVYLGYRLGHIKGESQVFRAVVYNKGAAVLHMLRRLIGDEAFFNGLRRFYGENRFRKAGTDDFRKAMEAASGRDLERFFERWIYDSSLPRLKFFSALDGQEVVVRFEQTGEVFDIPVTVTLTYTDGKTAEHVVAVTGPTVEARLPLTGTLRSVDANLDGAAVALIERK